MTNKDGVVAVLVARHARPGMVDDKDDKGIRVEDEVGDFEIGGKVVGPAKEEVREKGGGVVGMGSGPTEDVGAEEGEGVGKGNEGGLRRKIMQVLDTGEERGVGGEREDEGFGEGDDGEKGVEGEDGQCKWRALGPWRPDKRKKAWQE